MVVNRSSVGSFSIISGTPFACLEELRAQGVKSTSRITGVSSINGTGSVGDIYVMYYNGPSEGIGVVNWWTFDQSHTDGMAALPKTYDMQNLKEGLLAGGASNNYTGVDGVLSGALWFSGVANSTQYVTLDADSRTLSNEGTISVWIRTPVGDLEQTIYEEVISGALAYEDSDSECYVRLFLKDIESHAMFAYKNYGVTYSVSGARVSINTWTHLAVTSNGHVTTLYVNGNSGASFSGTNAGQWTNDLITSGVNSRFIGTFWVSGTQGAYYNGAIDNLRIYDRCLTANEVRQLVAAKL